MKKAAGTLFILALLGVAAFAFFLWMQGPTYQPPQVMPSDVPPPTAAVEGAIRYPLPETQNESLPALGKSDSVAFAMLSELVGGAAAKQFFQPQEIIRRIVVTVDNLPRPIVSAQMMPTTPVPGKFRINGKSENLTMAETNFKRYTPFVRLLDLVDAKQLAEAYIRFYPLFQSAYRDLGYPKGYFNDRLVVVIDHVLAAPPSEGKIALVQPHIFYKYADPELESLSAGHKLMIRMGNDNAQRVKAKLREIRGELVKGSVTPQRQ
ncbi:DUF3014 domain-containing protein [Noviherbaspirillum saxi]|uniref:DUF3014 domain-containing protein n=1 Tax=Noviherbaspirillum saxi TaxID=2320863 RepID=A0A3A3FVB0_9BURK|nr:DUF3014 domain-containing protein [Noviherbaspirillum saxi]RJF99274.1 DUF3014 domain-containing protein [Noviherbaspirillum saxi]